MDERAGGEIFIHNDPVPDAIMGDRSPERASQESRVEKGIGP
jgi:hypothetical protein